MTRKPALLAKFMHEVISYGGLHVTRETAYLLAVEAIGSKTGADAIAFSRQRHPIVDAKPLSLADARAIIAGRA